MQLSQEVEMQVLTPFNLTGMQFQKLLMKNEVKLFCKNLLVKYEIYCNINYMLFQNCPEIVQRFQTMSQITQALMIDAGIEIPGLG
jgi:hypothetical protein